jgi:UDP-N-acetyl-D-mannosaminuronic acid dehydrogenase
MRVETIHIYGAGFVGITLAGHLIQKCTQKIYLVDNNKTTLNQIRKGNLPVAEPGLDEIISKALIASKLELIHNSEVQNIETLFICISTPKEMLGNPVFELVKDIAVKLLDKSSIYIRSTAVVGTSRLVSELLDEVGKSDVQVFFAPERTAEGVALLELETLPQLIGGGDQLNLSRGILELEKLGFPELVQGSWEEVELAKLLCNVWRDYTFAFANELSLMTAGSGIDSLKSISIANFKYSRASIPKPGPVGGPCLSKDTYLLMRSFLRDDSLFLNARRVNEDYGSNVLKYIIDFASQETFTHIVVVGIAFKGKPSTNDIRNSLGYDLLTNLSSSFPNSKLFFWDTIATAPNFKRLDSFQSLDDPESNTLVILANNNPAFRNTLELHNDFFIKTHNRFTFLDIASNIESDSVNSQLRTIGVPGAFKI